MAKNVIAVGFNPGVTLANFEHIAKTIEIEGRKLRYLNCREAAFSTSTGFMRLVPVLPDAWEAPGVMALYLPSHAIAWMVEADSAPNQLGFV